MIEGIPKISVFIICYKQEGLIKRALDSLISQKDYLFEICVSDDCSPDNTWGVLQDYGKRYPDLLKLHRHEKNVGIFENIEYSWTMPTGDLVYGMAGDDEAGDGWFQKVVEFINENHINYKNELLCIYGDYKAIYPNGDSYIHSNKIVLSHYNPLKLSIRGLLGNRSSCYSAKILNLYKKVSQGRSYIAEASQDRQLQIFAEKNYYIPFVGNVYYAGIGVSTAINGERREQHLARWNYLLENLNKWGVSLDKADKNYIFYRKAKEEHSRFDTIKYWIKSIDLKLGLNSFQFRRVLFAFLRRLPHQKAISNFKV